MPEPKHVTHQYRDPAKAFNQRMAGMTKKQRARRERQLQAQLYNARINVLGRLMVNWFKAEEAGNQEDLDALTAKINGLLKMFTWHIVEKIRRAAEEAYEAQMLAEQNARIMSEFTPIPVQEGPKKAQPVPYTQEELDAFNAAGES